MENENLNKYAFWILDFDTTSSELKEYYNCSACNFPIRIHSCYKVDDYNFCPHCGRTIIHKTYKEN